MPTIFTFQDFFSGKFRLAQNGNPCKFFKFLMGKQNHYHWVAAQTLYGVLVFNEHVVATSCFIWPVLTDSSCVFNISLQQCASCHGSSGT